MKNGLTAVYAGRTALVAVRRMKRTFEICACAEFTYIVHSLPPWFFYVFKLHFAFVPFLKNTAAVLNGEICRSIPVEIHAFPEREIFDAVYFKRSETFGGLLGRLTAIDLYGGNDGSRLPFGRQSVFSVE